MTLTASFLDDVEKKIKGMWEVGMIPSIQRLEVALKDKHFATADKIRGAAKELLDKERIKAAEDLVGLRNKKGGSRTFFGKPRTSVGSHLLRPSRQR